MWEVQLCGDADTLRWLSTFLKLGGTSVEPSVKDDGFVLKSEHFTPILDASSLRREAEGIVRQIRGMVAFDRGEPRELYCGAVFRYDANGNREIGLCLHESVQLLDRPDASVSDAIGNPRPDRDEDMPTDLENWMALAATDAHVAKAFRLMDQDWEDWVGYYRLCEVMIDDRKGERALAKFAEVEESEIKRFKGSANSVTVGGDASRHGREFGQPPSNPMHLDDARRFIFKCLRHWLQSKVASMTTSSS
jgi:hypothetical protein